MSVKVTDVLDALRQMQKSLECSICLELLKDPHSTKCNHQFCGQCIRQVLEKSSKKSKNKWYCPLCKTPVSKRSLTPNPKLSEIVAAVRNLQGAVQDDTGVPTGSPPSQPLKSHPTGGNSKVDHVSNLQPTSRKCVTGHRSKQNASRKNQFSVYIDTIENAEQALESKQPQVVSNVNIRSSLRPLSETQIMTKATNSNKVTNIKTTRKTRNSRRLLAQNGHLEDISVEKDANEELLHMIDTMTFKPVSNRGSSKDFILDPSTLNSKPDQKSTPSYDSSTSTKTLTSKVNEDTGCKEAWQSTSVQQERTICLTTIAEADSSIRTTPSSSAGFFGNKNSIHCKNTANIKDIEGAVSSSRIDSIPQQSSSIDTMQSVSILSSLDCQPRDVVENVCDTYQKEGNHTNEAITCQDDKPNKLITDERCNLESQEEVSNAVYDNPCTENLKRDNLLNKDVNVQGDERNNLTLINTSHPENNEEPDEALPEDIYSGRQKLEHSINEVIPCQGYEESKLSSTNVCDLEKPEEPFELDEERQTRDHRPFSLPADTTMSSESALNSVGERAEQSLDFEGLVSLFDDPSSVNPPEAFHKEENKNTRTSLDKSAEQLQQDKTVNEKTTCQPIVAMQQVETVNRIPSISIPKKERTSPCTKGRIHADMLDNETTDSSDLCERVKQRQRRRTPDMPLPTKRYSDCPKRSRTTQQKAEKRSVDSVICFKTHDNSSPKGSAKKKFKASEGTSPGQASPLKANTAKDKSKGGIGVFSEQQEKEENATSECDKQAHHNELEADSHSSSSGKTVLSNGSSGETLRSNEVIPASVSSSENSNSVVINPMVVYTNQTSEGRQGGARGVKEDLGSQETKTDEHGTITEELISVDDHPLNLVTGKERSQDKKRNSCEPPDKSSLNAEGSAKDFTSQQLSGLSQKPFICATGSQKKNSEQMRLKEKEQKTAPLEDEVTSRQSLSQQLSTGHLAESFPFDPSEKALIIASGQSSQFKEDVMKEEACVAQVDIDGDTQRQRNNLRPSKRHLMNSPEGKISGDTENDKEVTDKCPSQAAKDGAKTSKSLSEETHNSTSTPIQSSLEVEALTPCLFENDSWETPNEKESQKRARSSNTLHEEIISENKFNANEADFQTMCALGESEARNKQLLVPGVVQSSASIPKETTSDSDPEGTQNFGTSQSISVLHDLEFPSQEQEDSTCNEERSSHFEKNFNTETKSDNTWAEPLPKKPRTGRQSESQGVDPNMSSEDRVCPNSDKTHSSECMESEVIPPTPPVKPVIKQVCGNPTQSPLKLSRSRMKLQRKKDEANCHSEHLAVKQKKRIKGPRCSKSPRLQGDKGDGAGTHCRSVGGEISEASVSLLADHPTCRSPRKVIDKGKNESQATEPEYDTDLSLRSKQLKSSLDRSTKTTVNKSNINPTKSRKDLTKLSKSRKQRNLVENISPQDLDEPRLSQSNSNSHVSQSESQIGGHPEDSRHEGLKGSSLAEVESVHSSPCSPVKQRFDGDSFDWSGTQGTRKGSVGSQNGVITLDNRYDKKEHFKEREGEDCFDDLLYLSRASQARHEVEDSKDDFSKKKTAETPNPFLVNNHNGYSLSVGDERDSHLTDDGEGDSSDDEALLKPVFLPKELVKSGKNELSCQEDAHDNDEDEEAEIFSQELIPSENNDDDDDDDDDDKITTSSKALDSTGASSATFLSEAAASTQKMEVLRQDVEAMEKEMEELRAYLAKTDENRDEEDTIEDDDMDYQEADEVVDAVIQPSLTPPPPLTPKSIPPMRQLSTPLKDVSRYLDQEGQSSDEGSECEEAISNKPVKQSELRRSSCYQKDKSSTDKNDSKEKSTKKRPLFPNYEDDGLSITAVEHRQEETPSAPSRSYRLVENSQEKDKDKLIVVDDRDGPDSRTGSLLLVKRRKVTHDLVPRKSPVVSLLFTRAGKDAEKTSQSPRPVPQLKESSHATKKSSPFIYSRKRGLNISPIRGQDPSRAVLRDSVSCETVSREIVTGESASRDSLSRERLSNEICSRDSVPRSSASREKVSPSNVSCDSASHNSVPREMLDNRCHSPDVVPTKVKDATNKKDDNDKENKTTARQLSFVATRLNRQQLAEARALAETYGGKLASEFNTKTSHVIMTTDENMQVTRHSYTIKYLLGLALGKWIVSHRWIAACKQAKTLVPEPDYEVKGDSGLGQTSIPRVARTARNNMEALLFEDFDVLCFGGFSAAVSKEHLSQLLKFCGARVFTDAESLKRTEKARQRIVIIDKETRDNFAGIKAICRHLNTKPVSLEWVTDSIANYKIQDSKDYVVGL